jgi:hypothetical protein
MAPTITIRDIAITERKVAFTHPFRFGAVTVEGANEVFVQVEIDVEGYGRSRGATAELIVPKWFDKNPALSLDETVQELRTSLAEARSLYLAAPRGETAFGLHAACYRPLIDTCVKQGMPKLAAAYGAAEIDKAILDALLRAIGLDVFTGLSRNVMGLDARLAPDIDHAAVERFLSSRQPQDRLYVRHTVGMLDSLDALARETRAQGLRYFKIKLGGDPSVDCARLIEITRTLDAIVADYRITLDANEQYRDRAALRALADALLHDGALESANQRLAYIEQPMPREMTFDVPLGDLGKSFAFIIDEADDRYGAFPEAVALGYRGISSKSCKGIYKSLINGARSSRLAAEGTRAFVTGEDLTCQAGLAVQQDSALVAFHGIAHCERNGHHYANGFAAAHPREAEAFLKAHPDMYENADGQIRLRVADGAISIASLSRAPGFASAVDPAMINLAPGAKEPQAKKEMVL